MHPVHFEGASIIGKPKDMTDEQCFSIWATRGFHGLTDVMDEWHEKGVPPHDVSMDHSLQCLAWVTAWKPNKEDLEALNKGLPIYIRTLSAGLPPMAVFTIDENGNPNWD